MQTSVSARRNVVATRRLKPGLDEVLFDGQLLGQRRDYLVLETFLLGDLLWFGHKN